MKIDAAKFNIQAMKKSSGFTLIEVLMASVILFASIATVTMIYRGAFLASEKSEKVMSLNAAMPSARAQIREQVFSSGQGNTKNLSGNGKVLNINYKWVASVSEFKAAKQSFDPEKAEWSQGAKRYKLWEVTLTLELRETRREFSYKELSWNNVST